MTDEKSQTERTGSPLPENQCLEVLNVSEAAKYLRCSRAKIYDEVRRGVIPYARNEGRIIFIKTDLFQWVCSQRAGAAVIERVHQAEVSA